MKIAILGAGNIGGNLGRRWAKAGHAVTFGVRNTDNIAALLAECGSNASAADAKAAVAGAEVVAIALPWAAVGEVLGQVGSLAGKVVIDATNAVNFGASGPTAALTGGTSAAETIAAQSGGKVVKAFNTLGAEHILNPKVGGAPADVFLCGDDAGAKATVKQLAEAIGFSALDLGPLLNARVAESIAIAWMYLAIKGGMGRNIAFKVVKG